MIMLGEKARIDIHHITQVPNTSTGRHRCTTGVDLAPCI